MVRERGGPLTGGGRRRLSRFARTLIRSPRTRGCQNRREISPTFTQAVYTERVLLRRGLAGADERAVLDACLGANIHQLVGGLHAGEARAPGR